jgi:hypothetical protein
MVDLELLKQLTPEQFKEWEYYLRWYRDNGWEGDEVPDLAWKDLCRKYPELASAS